MSPTEDSGAGLKPSPAEAAQLETRDDTQPGTDTTGKVIVPSASFQGPDQDEGHGHNRNSSSTSQMSKVSGYHSLGGASGCHSRTSSYDKSDSHAPHHKRLEL